jgi:hypothetical protein
MKCPIKNKVCEYWNDYCGCDDFLNKKKCVKIKHLKTKKKKVKG